MAFRIYFTAEDLARTHLASSPRPLLETNLAVRQLQDRNRAAQSGVWRREVLTRLSRDTRALFELMPPLGYTPMFLDPNLAGNVREQLEAVRGTSRSEIRLEMKRFAQLHAVPGWARELDNDPLLLQGLADNLERVHAAAVAPHWAGVCARFVTDRAARAQEFLTGGIDRLLTGLQPERIRWRPPVLEVLTVSRLRGELHLDGRGLLLVPTVFGLDAPTVDFTGEQPYLTYPARHDGPALFPAFTDREPGPSGIPARLVALLGRTRAAVLCVIAECPGCSTGEVAAAARVSLSSASEHATVLRTAGLITTVRHRQTALHAPTPAGSLLVGLEDPARTTGP